MNTADSHSLTQFDFRHVLARHWRSSALCLLAGLVLAVLAVWLLPRNYRSQAELYVRLGRDSTSLDATATLGRAALASTLPSTRENEINTVTEILSSRRLPNTSWIP